MPNHIKNKLEIIGNTEQVKEVMSFLQAKEVITEGRHTGLTSPIDFNNIIPMPEDLNVTSGTCYAYGLLFGKGDIWLGVAELQSRFNKMDEDQQREDIELAFKYSRNQKEHGFITWYEWAIANWGTKWNAYSVFDERNNENTIWFETAWSGVADLILKVSQRFPGVTINYAYADEDTGSNTGRLIFGKGKVMDSFMPANGSKDAYDIAFDMRPHRKENYRLTNGNYQYVEEEVAA